MGIQAVPTDFLTTAETVQLNREARSSGVAWGAVIGGAFVSSALYLILLALGAGFGLSAVSPWSGATASEVGGIAITWLIVIEIVASGFGGYLTGRLRTKWTSIHDEEVFFRDTANGFLSWAVALVASVAFLAAAAATMTGGATPFDDASRAAVADPVMYSTDMLFRSDRSSANINGNAAFRTEAARIVANNLRQDGPSTADQNYLAQLVSVDTGLALADANRRVADVLGAARRMQAAEQQATAHFLLWLFLSLLLGALSASYAATIGGRQRDHVRSL